MAVLSQALGELADGGRLARAVDADDEQHTRIRTHVECCRLAEQGRDLRSERGVEIGQVRTRLEALHELCRRGDADVCADQCLLEPLPRLCVPGLERGS